MEGINDEKVGKGDTDSPWWTLTLSVILTRTLSWFKHQRTSSNTNTSTTPTEPTEAERVKLSTNYYEVLKLERTASSNEIKKSFKILAMKLHPDKNPTEEGTQAFKILQEAYDILNDEEKRKQYDTMLQYKELEKNIAMEIEKAKMLANAGIVSRTIYSIQSSSRKMYNKVTGMVYKHPKRVTSAVLVVAYFSDKLRMTDIFVITISYVVHHITASYEELISPDNLRTDMEKEVAGWEPKKFIIITIECAVSNFVVLGLFIAYVMADWQNVLEYLWSVYDQYIESWNKRVAEEKAKEEAAKKEQIWHEDGRMYFRDQQGKVHDVSEFMANFVTKTQGSTQPEEGGINLSEPQIPTNRATRRQNRRRQK